MLSPCTPPVSTNCVSSEIVSPLLHFGTGASLHDDRANAVFESYQPLLCWDADAPVHDVCVRVCEVFASLVMTRFGRVRGVAHFPSHTSRTVNPRAQLDSCLYPQREETIPQEFCARQSEARERELRE